MSRVMGTDSSPDKRTPVSTAEVDVAIVIAITQRPDHVERLYEECRAGFEDTAFKPRFVLVAEPWALRHLERFKERRDRGEPLTLLLAGETAGETTLVRSAVAAIEADFVITMPAYPRVQASVLPKLIEPVRLGADMAVAKRWPRRDSMANRWQTRAFHALLRFLTGSTLNDVASGVRAMRPELLKQLPMYGDFGRFLPILASRQGYRVVEVESEQHELDKPTRVYHPGVYLRRLLDVLGLFFLMRFTEKPLRFFGMMGLAFSGVGGALLVVLTIQRFQGEPLADRPALLLGVLLLVLGVQAIALGLVGEIIVHLHAARRRPYRLAPIDAEDQDAVDTD